MIENWETFLNKTVGLMGFSDYRVEVNLEDRRASVYIYDSPNLVQNNLPILIESFNHLINLTSRQKNENPVFVDFNNYRKERETLIAELARTAARKVSATKEKISLPAMNSYERRIVHTELSMHPGVATESSGSGKERHVIIRPILEDEVRPATPSN